MVVECAFNWNESAINIFFSFLYLNCFCVAREGHAKKMLYGIDPKRKSSRDAFLLALKNLRGLCLVIITFGIFSHAILRCRQFHFNGSNSLSVRTKNCVCDQPSKRVTALPRKKKPSLKNINWSRHSGVSLSRFDYEHMDWQVARRRRRKKRENEVTNTFRCRK